MKTGGDSISCTWDMIYLPTKLRKSRPWRKHTMFICLPIGSMYAIYGNIYHQYTPVMWAYIPYMDPMGIYGLCIWKKNESWFLVPKNDGSPGPLKRFNGDVPLRKPSWFSGGCHQCHRQRSKTSLPQNGMVYSNEKSLVPTISWMSLFSGSSGVRPPSFPGACDPLHASWRSGCQVGRRRTEWTS